MKMLSSYYSNMAEVAKFRYAYTLKIQKKKMNFYTLNAIFFQDLHILLVLLEVRTLQRRDC